MEEHDTRKNALTPDSLDVPSMNTYHQVLTEVPLHLVAEQVKLNLFYRWFFK